MSTAKSRKKQDPAPATPKVTKPTKKSVLTTAPGPQPSPGPKRQTKRDEVLKLLSRPRGSTLEELMAATDWQAHSVRGFVSGTVKKRLGLNVLSERADGESRRYRLATKASA